MSQQDWILMRRITAGEEKAVDELYERFETLVFKVSRQLMPTKSDAEDAVQEIFVRLWRTADRYDPRRAKLVTWVMLIARRHLIDRLRRNAVRPHESTFEGESVSSRASHEADQPDRGIQHDERNALLFRRIEELPELQRTVIELAYLQGHTLRQVSEQLDAPLGTVKSALSRGLMRLRERVSADSVG